MKQLHIKKYFFVVYAYCIYAAVYTQYYTLEHFDIDNGLPSNTVYKMLQDNDGYIWMGTSGGLCRFDGLTFKTYSNHRIFTEDMPWIYRYNNKVWGLTWSGKFGYIEQDSLYTQTFKGMYTGPVPGFFLVDRHGGYWIKTGYEQVIHYYPDGKLEKLAFKNRGLYQDPDGNIYGYGDGFSYYHVLQKRFIELKKRNQTNGSYSDYYIEDDVLWSQDDEHGYVYDGHRLDRIRFSFPLVHTPKGESIPVKQVLKDKNGYYWVHTDASITLYNADGSIREDLTAHLKNKMLPVNMLFIDRENNLWICTPGNGLYLLKNRNILNYDMPDGQYISQLSGSPDGYVLIAHQSGKLSLIDQAGEQHFFTIPDVHVGVSYGLHFSQGKFYGLINRNFFELSTHPMKLKVVPFKWAAKNIGLDRPDCFWGGWISAGHWVYALLKDSDKNYWLGTNKGLYIIPGPHMQWPFSYTTPFVRYRICKSREGKWLPDKEADTLDIGRVVYQNTENSTYITQILEDRSGTVWIASQCEGVWAYKNGRVNSFNLSSGLCSNNINSIYSDEKNRMWVSTNAGISCILPDGKISNISTEDGILSNQVNGVFLFHDSLLYIGTSKGLSVIDISQRQDHVPTAPVITCVKMGDETYKDLDNLQADYWQNDLFVEYISVNFKGKVKYKYMIEGLTNEWQLTENRNILIPKLRPGNYRLKIKAVSQNGVESDTTVMMSFSIAIPFWQTTAFWIILILVVFTLLFLISFYSNKRKIASLKLKKRIDELERRALLSQINPHFIFNSLSAIKFLVASGELEKADEYLQKFAVLMRNTLDFSESKWISLEDELLYISHYLALEKLRFSQFFDYEISVDKDIDPSYVLLPPMLLQPFIENAIRHGLRPKKNGKGSLRISFTQDEEGITIRIDDNGVGVNASLALKTQNQAHYQSKGMGLSMQRAALQGIGVQIIDKKEVDGVTEGTQVVLSIKNQATQTPKSKSYDKSINR